MLSGPRQPLRLLRKSEILFEKTEAEDCPDPVEEEIRISDSTDSESSLSGHSKFNIPYDIDEL